jgi:hypothetical protein
LSGESELVLVKSSFECIEELSTKDHSEYFDGQKELVSAANPTPMIWGEPTPWDHTMEMGMKPECLTPSMENRQKADASAEVVGISGDLQ